MTGEQVAALEGLGFAWEPRAEDFPHGLAELQAFVTEQGHARVPARHRSSDGYRLGAWVDRRRQERRAGMLASEQVAALDDLGFIWDPLRRGLRPGTRCAAGLRRRTRHARVPHTHKAADGFTLGAWVSSRRQESKKGRLRAEQVAALDALGFLWDPWSADFTQGLTALQVFVAEQGHARVPRAHQTDDGFDLGGWVLSAGTSARRDASPASGSPHWMLSASSGTRVPTTSRAGSARRRRLSPNTATPEFRRTTSPKGGSPSACGWTVGGRTGSGAGSRMRRSPRSTRLGSSGTRTPRTSRAGWPRCRRSWLSTGTPEFCRRTGRVTGSSSAHGCTAGGRSARSGG